MVIKESISKDKLLDKLYGKFARKKYDRNGPGPHGYPVGYDKRTTNRIDSLVNQVLNSSGNLDENKLDSLLDKLNKTYKKQQNEYNSWYDDNLSGSNVPDVIYRVNQKKSSNLNKVFDQISILKYIKEIISKEVIKESIDDNESPLELAQMSFETGHWFDLDDFDNADDYEEYIEYMDLGPSGFYEEYKDELDFDPDFAGEYSDDVNYIDEHEFMKEYEDDDFNDVNYIDEEIDLGDFYAEGDEWDKLNDYYDLADSEAAWHDDYYENEDDENYLWDDPDASNNNMFEALRNRKRMQESFSSTTYQVTVGEPSNHSTYTVKANSSEEAVNLVADIMWEEESPYIIDEYEMKDALDDNEYYDNLVEAGSYGGYINLLSVTEVEDDSDNYTLDKINESIKLSESTLYDDVKKEIKPVVEDAIYHFENDLGKEYTEEDIIEEIETMIFYDEDNAQLKYPVATYLIEDNPKTYNTFVNAVRSILDELGKLTESIETQTESEKETQPAEEKVDKDMFPTKDSLAQDSANPLQDQTDEFTKEVTGDLEQDKETVEEIKEKTLDEAYTEADYQEDKKFADFFKQKMIDAGIPNTEILSIDPDIDLGYEKYYVKFEMDISLEDLEKPFERLMKDGYIPVETKEDPEARIIYVTFEFEL